MENETYTKEEVIAFGMRLTGWNYAAVESILHTFTQMLKLKKLKP